MADTNFADTEIAPQSRRNRPVSAVHQVYDELKKQIIDLTLAPGAVLSKNGIAEEFGISPTPVREALLRLEEQGLVDIYPQSRTVVALIDIQEAREAHFLRLSVEVEIARRLADAITDEQIERLRGLIERQAFELRLGHLDEFVRLDDRFHETMYRLARVGGLWNAVRSKRAHLDRLRRLHLPTEGKAASILEDHGGIVDALAARDSAAAEAATRQHLRGTVFASDGIRAQYPGYFR